MRLQTNGLVGLSFACRWMTYELEFHEKAWVEWGELDKSVRERLKAKLAERLENPRVAKDRLSGQRNRYKIKLKKPGVRLVYEVDDNRVFVMVMGVGKREGDEVYRLVARRTYIPR